MMSFTQKREELRELKKEADYGETSYDICIICNKYRSTELRRIENRLSIMKRKLSEQIDEIDEISLDIYDYLKDFEETRNTQKNLQAHKRWREFFDEQKKLKQELKKNE